MLEEQCRFGGVCPWRAFTSVNLTTAWSVQAAYEHFWTPSLRTSLVGAYTDISYNDTASSQMCRNVNSVGGVGGATALAGGISIF